MPDPQPQPADDETIRGLILTLACDLRTGDDIAIQRALRAAQTVASPAALLVLAAQLIDVDRPVNRWWNGEDGRQRCAWSGCRQPHPRLNGSRRYCPGGDCFRAARRAYWQARAEGRRRRGEVTDVRPTFARRQRAAVAS